MSLKRRVEKLEAVGVSCLDCAVPAMIQFYDSSMPELPPPRPRICPRCGRDRGISQIVVMIPDNGRDRITHPGLETP
jgi:hypothetical protein